jgi:hypothetical protein
MVPIPEILERLGGGRVEPIALPAACSDGMVEAYFGRPEAYLEEQVRRAQSVWRRLPAGVEERIARELAADLASGAWDRRHRSLRTQAEYASSLRLVVSPRG